MLASLWPLTIWRSGQSADVVAGERIYRLKLITLLLALLALITVILRLARPPSSGEDILSAGQTSQPSPSVSTLPPAGQEPLRTPLEFTPQPETATGTLLPSTPVDEWASALLDQVLPLLNGPRPPSSGLAWWQSTSIITALQTGPGDVALLNGQPFEANEHLSLEILIPEPANPDRLNRVGMVRQEGSVLTLTVSGGASGLADVSWVLNRADASLALHVLAVQAGLRDVRLLVAYGELPGQQSQLVIVGSETLNSTPTITPAASGSPTPTTIVTPTSTRTPTPTRAPEVYLGRVMAAKIDPVIDAVAELDPHVAGNAFGTHPWLGPLTWTESGAAIGGRMTYVEQAERLIFYMLQADGQVVRLFEATYDGNVTRLPDDLLLFQGQRMEEMLYWLARRAGERNGQLIVAYDDFGVKQAITIVGFRPFTSTQP